jgi:hypothetical protein
LGDIDMVQLLLRNGADPSVGTHCGVLKAAAKSNFSIFKILFDQLDAQAISSVIPDIIRGVSDEVLAEAFIPLLQGFSAEAEETPE